MMLEWLWFIIVWVGFFFFPPMGREIKKGLILTT